MSATNNNATTRNTVDYVRELDMRAYDCLPFTIRRLLANASDNVSAVKVAEAVERHGPFAIERDLARNWQPKRRLCPLVKTYLESLQCPTTPRS